MSDDGHQFQAELSAAHKAVGEHRRLSERLGVVQSTLAEARDEFAQATEVLVAETAEVRKLESLSLTRIWAALRGKRADQLTARRSEQDAAKARVAAARAVVDTWERELSAARAGLEGLGDVDTWHAAALAAKETWAIQVGAHGAGELRQLSKQTDALRLELTELREVAGAIDHARTALTAALHHLDRSGSLAVDERRARAWPHSNSFILSDGRKADEMDQAVGLMRKAGASLHVLSRQMDGLGYERFEQLMAHEFIGTFDFLFDNRFNNELFMNRLEDTLDRVHGALGAVEQAHQSTDLRIVELGALLADLDQRRERLLMSM
ncbi:hypothetical protein [Promicromonospora iranensis]|uniref:Lambda repressor-like predicted transcriptional regulator n=1 Tax=Promicromonospora iranensis TaxID=1105144 RepID=A0ABU2CSR3_9MICO|nr:hypothetical protein [Promicromonospora iranensis]MDR7384383.1 lambda repressor-like predicted transcriptional regulator [Promicromonospora iranensis]